MKITMGIFREGLSKRGESSVAVTPNHSKEIVK